ncbi:GNAT family N-acetyltransferase [Streptomyces sp. NPDC056883]|uniref:GNAT family N-acetyltransferase n=1 Tax=Streptomyces sp. NPDC056883 TaxID=3345959 RepID=UPI0036D19D42
MDDRYRIRDLAPGDVDAAQALLQLAAEKQTKATREATRMLLEMTAAGDSPVNKRGFTLVAEDTSTGRIVGAATVGPTGLWSHPVLGCLPKVGRAQWLERIGELYEVAVHPDHRRRGIGYGLIEAVAAHQIAANWRLLLWYFHADSPDAAFHPQDAMWPVGQEFRLTEPSGRVAMPVREMNGDLRLCISLLHPATKVLLDPASGQKAVAGIFSGSPWEVRNGAAVVVPKIPQSRRPKRKKAKRR